MDRLYAKSHEWLKVDGDTAKMGISEHAQSELGDIVYIELPEVGAEFKAGDVLCEVESVKAVSEIYMPVDGVVTSVNEALEDAPELINEDALNNFICEIEVTGSTDHLVSKDEYLASV